MKLFRATLVLAIMSVRPIVWAQSPPTITLVANAEGANPVIAPNTWVEIKGSNLAPPGISSPDSRRAIAGKRPISSTTRCRPSSTASA